MDRMKRFLEEKLGLSVGDIGPIALSLGVAVIIISVVALVLGTMTPQTYQETAVTNETFNATSDPYTLTVSHASDSDFVELTDATVYKTSDYLNSTSELADSAYNISDSEAGTIELSTSVDSGNEAIDYKYDEETTSTGILTKGKDAMSTFSDWFNIIVIVAVAAIILGLVMLFRGSSRGGGV